MASLARVPRKIQRAIQSTVLLLHNFCALQNPHEYQEGKRSSSDTRERERERERDEESRQRIAVRQKYKTRDGSRRRRGRRRLSPRHRPRNELPVLVSKRISSKHDQGHVPVRESLQSHRFFLVRVFSVQSSEQNCHRCRARKERVHVFVSVAFGGRF